MEIEACPVRCSCGSVRGVARELGPAQVNRVQCYCKFCATFADVLGRSEDMLDERRGSDIFQMSPRKLELHEGLEHLACLRLTRTGAMRFYASCCNTPIANTIANSKVPFMGVSPLMIPWQELGKTREEVLGPVAARVNGRFEPSEAKAKRARTRDLMRMLVGLAPKMLRWGLRGDLAHSPLVDAKGRPKVEPRQVERDARLQPTGASRA